MKTALLLSLVTSTVFLSSCATKFSAAQREALSTVAIRPTEVQSKAYSEPFGGDEAARDRAAASGAGGGMIGALVASAVANGIAGTQNSMFRDSSGKHFPAVQRHVPGNLANLVNSELTQSMKSDRFFGPRVRGSSANTVTSTITSYNLMRSGKTGSDELLFSPRVVVYCSLTDGAGKNLFTSSATGVSPSAYSISEFAADPSKSKAGYAMAASRAVDTYMASLAAKTAD